MQFTLKYGRNGATTPGTNARSAGGPFVFLPGGTPGKWAKWGQDSTQRLAIFKYQRKTYYAHVSITDVEAIAK